MKKALIVVDYQYDFVADDGLLTIGKIAQNLENIINQRVEKYLYDKNDVIFTLDTHTKLDWDIHPESKSFSIHCEKGTKGHKLFGKLQEKFDLEITKKLYKKGYCPKSCDLEKIVVKYDEIEVVGVVTDICVLQTVIGIYNIAVNLGNSINIKIFEKGCASFDEEKHKFAIDYFKNILGCEII